MTRLDAIPSEGLRGKSVEEKYMFRCEVKIEIQGVGLIFFFLNSKVILKNKKNKRTLCWSWLWTYEQICRSTKS